MICKMCGYKNSRFNTVQEVIEMLQMNKYYLQFLCLANSFNMLEFFTSQFTVYRCFTIHWVYSNFIAFSQPHNFIMPSRKPTFIYNLQYTTTTISESLQMLQPRVLLATNVSFGAFLQIQLLRWYTGKKRAKHLMFSNFRTFTKIWKFNYRLTFCEFFFVYLDQKCLFKAFVLR